MPEEPLFVDENNVDYTQIWRLDAQRVIAYRTHDPLPAQGYIVHRPLEGV